MKNNFLKQKVIMNIGITGFSGSGKTTLFNSFTGNTSENSKTKMAMVSIPDERLTELSELFKPKKTTYSLVQFEDLPSLDVHEKSEKVRFYERMRVMDAYVIIISAFKAQDAQEVQEEIKKMRLELIIGDLEFVINRMEKLDREMQLSPKNRDVKEKERAFLLRLQGILEEDRFIFGEEFEKEQNELIRTYGLLTLKPACFVLNFSENQKTEYVGELVKISGDMLIEKNDASPVIAVNALIESDIASMSEDDRRVFIKEYAIEKLGRDKVIQTAFKLLDLINFFTVGENECRSWIIRQGSTALDAAGSIHTDFARGFIRAEVIAYDELLKLGSLYNAKNTGKLRLEGKTYIVKDGEIVHIMFNVSK